MCQTQVGNDDGSPGDGPRSFRLESCWQVEMEALDSARTQQCEPFQSPEEAEDDEKVIPHGYIEHVLLWSDCCVLPQVHAH